MCLTSTFNTAKTDIELIEHEFMDIDFQDVPILHYYDNKGNTNG